MPQVISLFAEIQVSGSCWKVWFPYEGTGMVDDPIVERIDPDLEELMERFFDSSKKDVEKMQSALDARDFATLIRLGHTAKGTGYGYGFRGMGDIGLELEDAAKARNEDDIRTQIKRMAHYLDTVKVEFGE